jgi:catechol 2,3-dioxygenase-like lactoylglutathione lyase family enzyme
VKLDGLHHVSAITADVDANLDFYHRLRRLGRNFVIKARPMLPARTVESLPLSAAHMPGYGAWMVGLPRPVPPPSDAKE